MLKIWLVKFKKHVDAYVVAENFSDVGRVVESDPHEGGWYADAEIMSVELLTCEEDDVTVIVDPKLMKKTGE